MRVMRVMRVMVSSCFITRCNSSCRSDIVCWASAAFIASKWKCNPQNIPRRSSTPYKSFLESTVRVCTSTSNIIRTQGCFKLLLSEMGWSLWHQGISRICQALFRSCPVVNFKKATSCIARCAPAATAVWPFSRVCSLQRKRQWKWNQSFYIDVEDIEHENDRWIVQSITQTNSNLIRQNEQGYDVILPTMMSVAGSG